MDERAGHKNRTRTVLRSFLAVFAVLSGYYVLVRLTGHGIPCLFYLITGLKCPGCGMTHAMTAAISGNWREAMEYNALSLTMMPVFSVYLLYRGLRYARTGESGFCVWELAGLGICCYICIGYGIFRNFMI